MMQSSCQAKRQRVACDVYPSFMARTTAQLQMDLLEAARAGRESDVARLLALDPSLVDARPAGWCPLHMAATYGHDGVVAQLLAFSPQSSDARDYDDRTVLHFAAEHGYGKVVARLLAHNPALIDTIARDKMTALHFAACEGHDSTVAQLLNYSPGLLDLKNTHDQTALHIAAARGHFNVVVELLTFSPQSRVHSAPRTGDESTVMQPIVLHLVVSRGHVKVLDELLARRLADEDLDGRTPLFCAASGGLQEVVDLFPLTTDQVHHRDRYGNTLLHMVLGGVKFLKPALIQTIWEMNPDALFVANVHGETPFDFAVSSDHEWAIEHFQWKVSIWSVEETFVNEIADTDSHTSEEFEALQRREQRFRELVQGESERALLLLLVRDCVRLISDYLFISDSIRGGLGGGSFKRAKVE